MDKIRLKVRTGKFPANPDVWYAQCIRDEIHLVALGSGRTEREALLRLHENLTAQLEIAKVAIYETNNRIFETPSPDAHPQ